MYTPNLEKEDIDILLDAHEAQKKKYEQQIEELNSAIKRLEDKISSLKKMPLNSYRSSSRGSYESDSTWNSKITSILQMANKPLTTTEIVQFVLDFEPDLQRKSVLSSISATLSAAAGKKYKRIEQEGKDMQYVLM